MLDYINLRVTLPQMIAEDAQVPPIASMVSLGIMVALLVVPLVVALWAPRAGWSAPEGPQGHGQQRTEESE